MSSNVEVLLTPKEQLIVMGFIIYSIIIYVIGFLHNAYLHNKEEVEE